MSPGHWEESQVLIWLEENHEEYAELVARRTNKDYVDQWCLDRMDEIFKECYDEAVEALMEQGDL